jgi:hypothetical protein
VSFEGVHCIVAVELGMSVWKQRFVSTIEISHSTIIRESIADVMVVDYFLSSSPPLVFVSSSSSLKRCCFSEWLY